uniref:Putative gustatory receptor 66a n=1 Tax=Lygus hesperus TaxID=30085 RepID=A0A0A9XQ25_LYGHE
MLMPRETGKLAEGKLTMQAINHTMVPTPTKLSALPGASAVLHKALTSVPLGGGEGKMKNKVGLVSVGYSTNADVSHPSSFSMPPPPNNSIMLHYDHSLSTAARISEDHKSNDGHCDTSKSNN